MKHNRKGQSALEFIMTYGWAILVVLVMIGALAYFGVLNPRNYLPDKCLAPAGFNCRDYQVKDNVAGNMQLLLMLENKGGTAIKINAINATYIKGTNTYQDSGAAAACGVTFASAPAIPADGAIPLTCLFGANGPGVGQPVTINMVLTYQDPQGAYPHVANLQVQTKTQ